ncbi:MULTISPECIES: class I SAM-dependent methyltransferase [Mesorhizobium]|uniref:Class I SAM-dependent methyltransferase n=1 Tax=Mesorhizobium abyssinicae TaxID=1209958 RepID=A0ABU5AP41_9HYPH|nr:MULTISPECIES: class I SAM-dependent methyltransferase [Mesorhizobium]MDX8538999.1 class I SAM-dependent methyltransferase [Mesorhizobium abyssinicae]
MLNARHAIYVYKALCEQQQVATKMTFEQIATLYSDYANRAVSTELHPNDVMYNTGPSHYFNVGKSGVQAILTGLSLSWRSQVMTVLDLPCGHGRVGRHLRQLFPNAELFYCDIDAEGADFCARAFGGKAIHSKADLLQVDLPKKLDMIWVGSLFTHVDKRRTDAWLHYLADHLSDHGVLVATFHGYFTGKNTKFHGGVDEARVRREFETTGFGYSRYTTLAGVEDYGLSLSKPSAVLDIADTIPGVRASYIERGWANNHDVLVINKNDRLATLG